VAAAHPGPLIDADVLLALLRGEPVATPDPVDWARVWEVADKEGVAPLLHARVETTPALAAALPASIRGRLREGYERTWARNTVLLARYDDVLAALGAAGIRALALKGIALLGTVYGDPGLRPMSDIDVLVPMRDFARAKEALVHAGWTAADGPDADANAYRGYTHLTCRGAVLDLHREVAGYPRVAAVVRVDHAGLWQRAQPLPRGGSRLAIEDQILHLALHLVLGSEFGRLLNFVDIDRIVRQAGRAIAWDAVLDEGARWRVRGALGYALRVAARSLGTPVPADVLARLRPAGPQRLVARVLDTERPPTLMGRPGATPLYLAETLLMDRPRWLLRVLVTTLFPPAPWLRFHYGTHSTAGLWWARVVHPLRVCALALGAAP